MAHRIRLGGAWPAEKPLARDALPEDIAVDGTKQPTPDHLLPALLKPAEKRTLDLLSDWPWITPAQLGGLLGVKHSRLSHLLQRLGALGLIVYGGSDNRRLTLTDRGLGLMARRDRNSLGTARRRWSVTPSSDSEFPVAWRNVSGTGSRQLLRNAEHTDAVHWFMAVLARQARAQGWEVFQMDPPRRASRYFRYGDRLHSVRPDAFGVLRKEGRTRPFFLEWERRFLRVAREEMGFTRGNVPVRVSYRRILEVVGPLGEAWLTPDPTPIHSPTVIIGPV